MIRRPDDPGFRDSLAHQGMAVELNGDAVERLGPSSSPFIRAAQVFRAFVGRSIARLFPAREAGLLLGLALGDASQLDAGMMRDFQASGLGHLLVVSGENVAMVLAPILGLASLLRLTRWPRFGLGVGTVAFFVVMTGAEPSVMRAGVMATIALVGVLIGRPRATGSILAAAVLVLVILDPWLVWSIGFQLSVAATAGMVALASPIGERLRRFVPSPVALAAGTTLAAQLGVTPLLLFHFHEVPGVTIIANLMAFPAVSPALLLGLVAAVIGLVSVAAGHLVAALALMPMRYLEWVADRLAKAPVGHVTSGGGPAVLVIGGAAVVALAWALHRRWRPPRPVIVLAVAAFPLVVWSTALGVGAPSGLVVRFFDVGQGDAALVTSPSGVHMLVDGGPDQEEVATDLAALGVKRLDVVVATHPHADHIIGLPDVLGRVPVGLVLEPGCPDTSAIQSDLDVAIADEHVPVRLPARRRLLHGRRSPIRRAVARPLLDGYELRPEQRLVGHHAALRGRHGAVRRRAGATGAAGAAGRACADPCRAVEGAASRCGHVAPRVLPGGRRRAGGDLRGSTERLRPSRAVDAAGDRRHRAPRSGGPTSTATSS